MFLFSVIIPTYNGGNNIEKTITNIFENLLFSTDEIIVVNDGSTDKTLEILQTFANNTQIKIITQSNKGVSSARNKGIANINKNSSYVTFVDDSDYVSKGFFKEVLLFFNKHLNIDVIATPMSIIKGSMFYEQNLNYRFKSDKNIINITKDYKGIQFHVGGLVFKKNIFENNKYLFDETINYWEDAKTINTIFLDKKEYGLVKKARYFYNRNEKNSLSIIAWNYKNRYAPHITNNYKPLIKHSIENYGKVINYIQFLIITHYLNYMLENNKIHLRNEFINENQLFKTETISLLKYISIEIIDELNIPNSYKRFLYNLKGSRFPEKAYYKDIKLFIQKYSFTKKELLFSFSHESFGISDSACIYFYRRGKCINKAELYNDKPLEILGVRIQDFSRKTFKIRLSWFNVIIGCHFIISDENLYENLKIESPSLFSRLFNRLKKKVLSIVKQ